MALKHFFILFGVALCMSPLSVFAAAYSGLEVSTNPTIPRPGEEVTLTAQYIGEDPGRYLFVWIVDDDERLRGVGNNSLTLTAPRLGESLEVVVSVEDQGTVLGSRRIVLRPAELTIEWEGNGARAPFAPNRPLLSGHGSVRVHALANFTDASGRGIPEDDIYFSWEVNGTTQKGASGYGKKSTIVQAPFFTQPFTIRVTGVTRDKRLSGADQVTIRPRSPEFVVYQTSPLSGLSDSRAIVDSFNFQTTEVSFVAFPLHVETLLPGQLTWLLNGAPVASGSGDQRTVTFRKAAEGSGEFEVGVEYRDALSFLNRFARSFLVYF